MALPPAILFGGDSYSTEVGKLMGRQSAGAGFIKALINAFNDKQSLLRVLLQNIQHEKLANDVLLNAGWTGGIEYLSMLQMNNVSRSGTLFIPAPGLADMSWKRARHGERSFSLTGIIHTIATHAVMTQLCDVLIAPVRRWDALICTSVAGKNAVESVLAKQKDYLKWRFKSNNFEFPELPVIPLGIHSNQFFFPPEKRLSSRHNLGINDDDVVILFAGRLSFHAKAHPHPMLLALERCAIKRPSRRIHLIQCGEFANDAIKNAFEQIQYSLAPSLVHHHLSGNDQESWRSAWSSADIFTSLSDNIQETFGLTPVEAMAAGLPVVVSDWDGYRDTVRHGVDGFRIATTMASIGDGSDLMMRYDFSLDNYDMYCGQLCEFVAVDVEQAEYAYGQLIDDPQLRRMMGASGLERARSVYDWKIIIKKYEALWKHLEFERIHSGDSYRPLTHTISPDRLEPFEMFSGYPTHIINDDDVIYFERLVSENEYKNIRNLAAHRYANRVLPTYEHYLLLVSRAQIGAGIKINKLLDGLDSNEVSHLRRGIVWMIKVDILKIRCGSVN